MSQATGGNPPDPIKQLPKAMGFWDVLLFNIATVLGPRWVAAADVNHDGNPDILVANADAGSISVLLGDGKGRFSSGRGSPIPAGHLPNDLAIADMNGDGNLDVVIPNHQSPYLTILQGDGTGKFAPAPGSPLEFVSVPGDSDGDRPRRAAAAARAPGAVR